MASNAAGSTNISTNLFISPRFLIRPQDVRTQIRFNESLTCEVESYPVPSYSWMKEGNVVGPSDYRYPFYPVEFGDEGEYTCIATSNSLSIDSSAIVHVSPLHSARTDPNVTNSVVNTPVTFNCLSLGGPNNMYYWVYDRTSERLSNVNELNVTSHASRGGSYTCTVGNQAGYDHAISTLNVAPEILIHPSPQNVTLAVESITLYCLVSGYPFPQVEWYLNDTQILPQSDTRVTITTVNNPTLIPGYDSMGEFSGSGLSDFGLGSGGDSLDIRNPFGVNLDVGDIKDPFGTVSSQLVIKDTTISDSGLYHCEGVIDNLFDDKPSQPALVLVQSKC
uniref:Ig-like domain-containing protein n=2 Tax=Amphimedon queenslandica TaxID=400682 RepID=A0A1X7SK22_AMPQE